MRFLIIFIFLISSVLANEVPNIKNIIVNKDLKKAKDIAKHIKETVIITGKK